VADIYKKCLKVEVNQKEKVTYSVTGNSENEILCNSVCERIETEF
jgi:hypothetical protein